jgi:hypothetical protein
MKSDNLTTNEMIQEIVKLDIETQVNIEDFLLDYYMIKWNKKEIEQIYNDYFRDCGNG